MERLSRELRHVTHRTLRKVSEDITTYKWNTLLAALMEFNNYLMKARDSAVYGTPAWDEALDMLLLMLAPETPHIAEELWQRRRGDEAFDPARSIHVQPWPAYEPALAQADMVTLVVQVNGKVREKLELPADVDEAAARAAALASPTIQKWLEGKQVRKVIYAGGKLINIVVS
ncbi:MAG: Leucine--tRNA ligase [Chloroflexi bacterium ADurb.Bin325]|nr:MAG: Leucine--tRNA ligase [Chloroflexi bacterium ADurb.Bin325]